MVALLAWWGVEDLYLKMLIFIIVSMAEKEALSHRPFFAFNQFILIFI